MPTISKNVDKPVPHLKYELVLVLGSLVRIKL
uniref:Uncharacterized protein n=1 Tax=Podoviridae sp. ctx9R1 TaxID=2826589 RepID=A0A8S5LWE5_9CAUD|nr:MAG TPA: hypothetical protein [Podoviridae sp. ctx9R1]